MAYVKCLRCATTVEICDCKPEPGNVASLPYPLRLVVELLHHCTFNNPHTADMQCGELLRTVEKLFGAELVAQARDARAGYIGGRYERQGQ